MAGLLDFNDPQTVGLLSAAAGLLQASGPSRYPTSIGQIVGQGALQGLQGAQATQQNNLARQYTQAQLTHLNTTDELTKAQVAAAQRQQAVAEAALAQLGFRLPGTAAQSAVGASASPVVSNPSANSFFGAPLSGAQPETQPQGSLNIPEGLRTPIALDLAFNGGKGAGGMMATFNKPFSGRAGAPVWGVGPDGKPAIVGFSPKLPEGATLGQNGQVGVAPGYAQTVTGLSAIPSLSAPMQTIKLSNQRELQLTQPEYIAYNASGGTLLPSRYASLAKELPGVRFGNAAQPAQAPVPKAAPANEPVVRTGAGGIPNLAQQAANADTAVVGSTQSQQEQIDQAAATERAKSTAKQLTETQFDAPAARSAVADALQNLKRMKTEAQAVLESPALSRITGGMSVIPNMPGSAASDVQARLNALKSQVGFSVLQAMRAASKTGGALGAISDKENELLQRNLAALDNVQSTEGMKRALKQVQDYADDAATRIQNAYRDQYERVQGTQGMTPTPKGAVPTSTVNPQAIVDELRRRGLVK